MRLEVQFFLRQYYLQTALSGEVREYVLPKDATKAQSKLEYLRGRIAESSQPPGRVMEAGAFEASFPGAIEESGGISSRTPG